MNLTIEGVKDRGVLEKERIELRALADLEIGEYAVFCAFKSETGVTNYLRTAYWFPDASIKAQELIVLYTKSGENKWGPPEGEAKARELYWHNADPLWGNDKFVPVLVLVAEWTSYLIPEATESTPKLGTKQPA